MKRKLFVGLLVAVCFILQNTIMNSLALASIEPNLLIIITASYGFMRGRKSGMWVGFFSGLLLDVFYGGTLGAYTALYMYIGYAGKTIIPLGKELSKEIKTFLFITGLWVWISFIMQFKSFWLVHCDYGRGVIDILGSICAVCCVLVICKWITEHHDSMVKGLAYLGQYSLIMLCTHIIELDLFPWRKWSLILFGELNDTGYLLFRICGKFLWIIPLTILLSRWNVSRKIFGYKEV